jgi:Zn-dependent peptidase ImmA (M78 family)/transcriptional regulator with XRE-family HTH domain
LDIEEVAKYTGISAARLEDFESGSRAPSFRQVELLAELYNLPIYLLYLDTSPNLEMVLADFRKVEPRPADLSPRGLVRLWSVEKISTFTRQLQTSIASDLPALRDLPRPNRLTTAYARELRTQFDSWFETKQKALSLSGPPEARIFTALRLYFETCGAVSVVNDAPAGDYMGFYSHPQSGMRSIFVNRQISSKKAQLFTLVHELAHSLIDQQGVSDPFSKASNSVERTCNRFAAEFLAPADTFREILQKVYRRSGEPISLIRSVSRMSLLSNQATAIRLLEEEAISQSEYRTWLKLWKKRPRQEKEEEKELIGSGGPGAFAKRVGELGYFSVYIASLAVKEKIVDSLDIKRGLGLSESIQHQAFQLASRRFEVAVD